MERAVDFSHILILLGAALVSLVVAHFDRGARSDPKPVKRALEGATLAVLGGFVAHLLVSVLLDIGDDSRGASLLVGWGFFFIPGVLDSVIAVFSDARPLTNPDTLLWLATAIGAFTGMMNGVRPIHDWQQLGVPQFLGDVSWGLSGSTTASLLHLWNLLSGEYAEDGRTGAHRYVQGFHVPGHDTFAFTQGCVMSNLREGPDGSLYRHERLHVFQSRLFGPFFVISYVGWMVIIGIVAAIKGLVANRGLTLVEDWSYFNNPWEVWSYHVQRTLDKLPDGADARALNSKGSIWSEAAVLQYSIPYFSVVAVASVLVVFSIY